MKKYLIILVLIAVFSGVAFAEESEINSASVDNIVAESSDIDPTVVNPADVIFRSSLTDIVQDLSDTSEEYSDDRDFQAIDPSSMPWFKQMRLKMSNKYLEATTRNDNKPRKPINWKFWQKNQVSANENININEQSSDIINTINDEIASEISDEDISLEGGINTEVTEKQLQLDADTVDFDENTGDMIAHGRPFLYIPPQNATVVADEMSYNEDSNIIKAKDNVVATKDGKPIFSDYFEIDMNEETMTMDNMTAMTPNMKTSAKNAVQKDGLLILTKGNMTSESDSISRITSRIVGPDSRMFVPKEAQSLLWGDPEKRHLRIHIEDVKIDAQKNHDVIKIKNARFYGNDKQIFKWPRLTVYTNKNRDYFEANYPEFGSRRKLGMFLGPGFVFGGPFGSVVKVIPFINYKKDFGIGGMLKYMTPNNRTELGYGSANEIFFLRGKQRLDDNLFIHYAANSYTDEWFLGARMAKYMAEIYYDKSYVNRNFIGKNMDLTFRHRAGFGLMEDDDRNYNGEKFPNAREMSTTRTRYMASLNQSLYSYRNEDKRIIFDAGVELHGSAALYGTGDTQFIAGIGPQIRFQYKNWMQEVSYFLTGYHDETPMPRYDAYRYGTQSVRLVEAFRINKYLSVGWQGYINLSDDSPNGKMFQENAFLFSIGPDDFKIVLGYDFVRQRTYFGFNVGFNPKGTEIEYDRMVIKNPERLGKEDENEHKVAYTPAQEPKEQTSERKLFNKNQNAGVLEYAQVIDIEDPDRERID